MRIAILSRYQNTSARGVESVVAELSKRLSEANHQVEILTGSNSDSFSKIISGNFDIVMPTNGRLQSLKASIGRLFSGYKLVIGGHSGIGKDDIWNIVVAKPDLFIALTKKEYLWAKRWAWGSKVVKIPNGVDLEKFKPRGDKYSHGLKTPVILSVGALSWYKFHDKVIRAVSKIPDASLLIVGKGDERENLLKLGKEKLGDRFKLIEVNYEQMPSVYRSADLFSLPSWNREAFGLVYLEAMATNIPVVAPDDDSRREIVGDGGILIDVDNIESYADRIDRALKSNWDNKPRRQAEKFSWDIITKEYLKCLKDLI